MGATESKTAVDIVNESITDAIIETASSSTSGIKGKQTVAITGWSFGTKYSQVAQLSIQSLQDVRVDNNLVAKMEEKIRQNAAANGILLSGTVASSSTNLQNILKTKVTTSTIQNAVASIDLEQLTLVEGVAIGGSVEQLANLFSENMQTALNNNQVAQSIVADVDQKSEATTTTGWGDWAIYLIIAIAVIILAIIIGTIVLLSRRRGEPALPEKPEEVKETPPVEVK